VASAPRSRASAATALGSFESKVDATVGCRDGVYSSTWVNQNMHPTITRIGASIAFGSCSKPSNVHYGMTGWPQAILRVGRAYLRRHFELFACRATLGRTQPAVELDRSTTFQSRSEAPRAHGLPQVWRPSPFPARAGAARYGASVVPSAGKHRAGS
jgi:hypothetical protein